MQIKPFADLILVEADKAKDKTESGILLAEEWKTLPPTGTVKAVGPDVTDVKEGDRIMFERYASIILEGQLRLCKRSHILARIDDEQETPSS